MDKTILLFLLKILMTIIFSGWIVLWFLKPTNMWTRKWKETEASVIFTFFGYYGLNFVVYSFPVIAITIIGLVYLHFLCTKPIRNRQAKRSTTGLSNPLVINCFVGVLSSIEILVVFFFILLLAWTFYTRISNDFKNLEPVKSLKLNLWQLKYLRVATRFGLLAEACLAMLLLPILRGLTLFQVLGIQFESSVRYHIWLGTSLIFFATVHGASTLFIWGVSHHFQEEAWRWQRTGRIYLAGEIALVVGIVIWITSLPQIRRKRFEIFYYMHHLYVIFLLFFLFHAGDRHFYMVFPGIFLFGLDKLLRIIQSSPRTCILSARVFPAKSLELVLPKDPSLSYTPTSTIYMKIPKISKFQWHPFSITSSSKVDKDKMSLILKCERGWGSSLYKMIQEELDANADSLGCMSVMIEGPYGPASLDFLRYESLVLIAGGIGITPFLSILKELGQSSSKYGFPKRIQLIYVVKSSQEICLLNSISSLLLDQASHDLILKLKVFVTQEEKTNVTVRELLNDMSRVRTVTFDTKRSSHAVNGLESPLFIASMAALASTAFLVSLMCMNHFIASSPKKGSTPEKMNVSGEKKATYKENTSSTIVDLLLLFSFITAITCTTFAAIILRWKRLEKKKIPHHQNQCKTTENSSVEPWSLVEEHDIQFGGRPNFQDIFSMITTEAFGSNVGVLVCGPRAMKESVASICQIKSQGLNMGAKGNQPYFNFHSLNFTL
ncbi:hypothetical protein K2173_001058 [Erythroxylum novogranatense]|uniref:FAD-binding FR-type domain-containing protein n=1 Tax=Erythroxylum novogranatense TaxID=1862640 RepID=A0AAV8SIE0_9ROSI|nr:hypothetical protein K2173_001058 [Erythroxylum novogranatense]